MPDWDVVYQQKSVADATPASVLLDNQRLLPRNGAALDFASGLSGNGLFLASCGLQVTAWDLSQTAVDKINAHAKQENIHLKAEKKDLEASDLDLSEQFDLIVVSFFLHRETLSQMPQLLKPGGLLFYQTFSGEQINGIGPSREAFRLKRGELLNVYSDMDILFYREDPVEVDSNVSGQVCFVARKL